MIDRYLLRYFLAVVDAGNFSRGAQQVNVTQPTLSVGIGKLEEALGARLFERNSQRVQLTEAGVRLLAHARLIEREFNSLERGLKADDPGRVLRIGVLSTLPTAMIAAVIRRNAAAACPDAVEIVEGASRDLLNRLGRRRIDIALTRVRPEDEDLPHEFLFAEGYSIAAPPDHPLAGHDAVPGETLAGEVMIVRRNCEVLPETSRYFTERGVRPRFSFRSVNDDRILALVRTGLGITVAPDSLIGPDLGRFKLAGFDHRRRIGLIFADAALAALSSPALAALRALG
ncbi:LysR family transcriptional regulator [Zavarzinia compransoris]|uniref:LysR family transcriptional regulator n=1 Tax=Zavarzinia compransoris TaxID=1264899 RepID=A0A317E3I1_9PROT|nr:LysR family transcriptional regulator [Zavarzinia compransoris]PWR21668.1 LysR family transcriptional regulator [Zavarzinia compransoris]TDP45550.1 DNA-binding transcriptional LysR family regulator [Zavarzinia compransoris]